MTANLLRPRDAAGPAANVYGLQRTIVIGTSGSGKSTIAQRIAQIVHAPYIEMDALNWEPNWVGLNEKPSRSCSAAVSRRR